MKRISIVILALVCASRASAASTAPEPVIAIEDVASFYKLYAATNGHPTADQLQHEYLDAGSDGLHDFARLRNTTGTKIAKAMADHPEIYAGAQRCMAVLPRVSRRVKAALLKLGRLYPEARDSIVKRLEFLREQGQSEVEKTASILKQKLTEFMGWTPPESGTTACIHSRAPFK